ncbi:cell division protein SepF [Candidatus Woesearchaeota archaeon]|nr:cell division protein SepF [Candidatus Woesearchaeota archaeon]
MTNFFSMRRFKKKNYDDDDMLDSEDEYVELDTSVGSRSGSSKVIVRPFVLDDFADIKSILECLREGNTICLVNISPLREKDMIELKRAVNKLKKTVEAIDGEIAGFGEDYVVVVPSFAEIHKSASPAQFED